MKALFKLNILALVCGVVLSCKEKTVEPIPPKLDAVAVSEITISSVRLKSAISHSGNQPITDYGFVYSETNATPTVDDTKTTHGAVDPKVPTPIDFSDAISSLKPGTGYYARAYTLIASGAVYGEVANFRTAAIVQPGIRTDAATAITLNTAKLQGTLTAKGSYDITEYGVCWSATNTSPTTADTKISRTGNVTTFPTSFILDATNLAINTSYNYRAYVIANGVTSYGNAVTFRTANIIQPGIRTDGSNTLTVNSAKLQGTLTSKGTYDITEYGICWSATNANPTTADLKASRTGNVTTFPTSYTLDATSLRQNTTYNFRAYVIANGVITYGASMTFKTPDIVQPGIRTDGSNSVTVNSARLQGTLTSKGTYDITEYGICWSATNANPTTADSKASRTGNVTTFPNSYTLDATSLRQNTAYNFRAYVIANGVITYGNSMTFRTPDIVQPGIRTDGSSNVTVNFARLQGTLTSGGSFAISEYGICWSSSNANPTTADAKATRTGNVTSFPSSYTLDANNLQPNTSYNYRAYVISNGTISYGNSMSFRTSSVVQPGIRTDGANNITVNFARLQGTVTSYGSYDISEYGICWSSGNQNPTVGDAKVARFGNVGGVPNTFTVDAGNLNPITQYYYRAYVVSNGVITYGSSQSFRTLQVVLPTITTGSSSIIGNTTVTVRGTIQSKGSYDITEYGVCWSSSNLTPTIRDSKASINGNPGSFPANYSVNATNLNTTVTHYYRAYVISNGVVTYGNVSTFYIGKI